MRTHGGKQDASYGRWSVRRHDAMRPLDASLMTLLFPKASR
jgi:hypothetical protein